MSIDKNNPFLAAIKERYRLSKCGSLKHTYHIVLDIEDSGIAYNVGDSIAIYASHSDALVERTIEAIRAAGNEQVSDKHGNSHNLRTFLKHKANITEVSRKLLREIATRQTAAEKREKLEWLFDESHKEALKAYLEKHELWDLLHAHPEVHFSPQEIADLLMPLLPRFYSIASSQSTTPHEIHLTVAYLRYTSNEQQRAGVCTHYLCELAPLDTREVAIYVQPHHGFTVPADGCSDMIMVGPGTGVAPFRAFMQERLARGASGRHWLFFGEWHSAYDYFYEEFWQELESSRQLQISTAFSRDQEHKVYVQNRMREQGQELYEWLCRGALFYVCGDAHRMAKDVDATLHAIVEEHGNKTALEAKAFIKQMRSEKRYLRDVY
jgi:sulfite reductase (NADPH) flavoprotein alpha-component